MKPIAEKYWHDVFEAGILIKAVTGTIETVSGFLLLFINPLTLSHFLERFSRGEKIEDPEDFFLNFSNQYLRHLTIASKDFAGLYILAHGLINLFLVFGLYKEKVWAYLIAIGVLGSFMLYQVFSIARHPSLLMEILTVFDVFFITLIWHEYNYLTKKLGGGSK